MERVRFDDHLAPGSVHRRRIVVRLVDNQAVAIETTAAGHTTLVGIRREAAQQGSLSLPHLSNRLRLPTHAALVISEAGLQQAQVQLLKRGHVRERHQKISATKPHRCFYPTFSHPAAGWQKWLSNK